MAGGRVGRNVAVPKRDQGSADDRQWREAVRAAQDSLVFVEDSPEEAVSKALEGGLWLTARQLAQGTGYSGSQVSRVISALKSASKIEVRAARIGGRGRPVPMYRRKV